MSSSPNMPTIIDITAQTPIINFWQMVRGTVGFSNMKSFRKRLAGKMYMIREAHTEETTPRGRCFVGKINADRKVLE
jgi:hypothetical protein